MLEKIKTILYTLMFVFIVTFIGTIYYTYNNSVAQEQEKFDTEVAETLEAVSYTHLRAHET